MRTGSEIPIYFDENEEERFVEINPHIELENFLFDVLQKKSELRTDHLDKKTVEELRGLLRPFKDVFFDENSHLSFTHEIKHEIKTVNEIPVYTKLYRYPEIHREEVNKQVTEMLKQGIIRHSDSPYSAPIWVVPKKMDASGQQKWRIVVDYRKLNNVTIDDKFPIPNIDSILDKLGRAMYFTTLDLAKGYHQVEIAEQDIKKTAFSTDNGHYEFTRMPFGLKNAPSTFQRLMNSVLKEYIGKICYVYLDDVIIFSTSKEEHFDSIQKILKRFQEANLKVQVDKSEFMKQETEFLGHIVTTNGVKPNPNKVEAIVKFPIPRTNKEIKSFLGLVGYYRKFIRDFAKIAKPMTKFLKKDKHVNVHDSEFVNAFNKLKLLITSDPILRYPDFSKVFTLTTDASNFALGAVLSQEGRPTCYASRTLNEHECNYSTIEKELLAIVWATKYFRPYLFGRKFIVRTDHKPLQWLHGLKEPNSKLQRWKTKLGEFNFEVEYLAGKENQVADALSRIRINKIEIEDEIRSTDATIHSANEDNSDYISITEYPINVYRTQIIIEKANEDEIEIKNVHKRKRYEVKIKEITEESFLEMFKKCLPSKGIVGIMVEDERLFGQIQKCYLKYFASNKTLKVNKCSKILKDIENKYQIQEIILKTHQENNHRGINATYLELSRNYYFPKLKQEICKILNNCSVCNIAKYERNPVKLPIKETGTPTKPHEIVHMDIWYKSKGNAYVTFIDKFSKHAQIIQIPSRNWNELKNALVSYLSSQGKPQLIITDQERGFNSVNFLNYLENEGIKIHFTTPGNHSSNADIERFHSTLNEHLRLRETEEKINRISFDEDPVTYCLKIYNETIHSTTKQRPIDFINGNIKPEEYEKIRELILHAKQQNLNRLNVSRSVEEVSPYLKINRTHKMNPFYKKVIVEKETENYLKLTKEKYPRYKSQFKKKFKYESLPLQAPS